MGGIFSNAGKNAGATAAIHTQASMSKFGEDLKQMAAMLRHTGIHVSGLENADRIGAEFGKHVSNAAQAFQNMQITANGIDAAGRDFGKEFGLHLVKAAELWTRYGLKLVGLETAGRDMAKSFGEELVKVAQVIKDTKIHLKGLESLGLAEFGQSVDHALGNVKGMFSLDIGPNAFFLMLHGYNIVVYCVQVVFLGMTMVGLYLVRHDQLIPGVLAAIGGATSLVYTLIWRPQPPSRRHIGNQHGSFQLPFSPANTEYKIKAVYPDGGAERFNLGCFEEDLLPGIRSKVTETLTYASFQLFWKDSNDDHVGTHLRSPADMSIALEDNGIDGRKKNSPVFVVHVRIVVDQLVEEDAAAKELRAAIEASQERENRLREDYEISLKREESVKNESEKIGNELRTALAASEDRERHFRQEYECSLQRANAAKEEFERNEQHLQAALTGSRNGENHLNGLLDALRRDSGNTENELRTTLGATQERENQLRKEIKLGQDELWIKMRRLHGIHSSPPAVHGQSLYGLIHSINLSAATLRDRD